MGLKKSLIGLVLIFSLSACLDFDTRLSVRPGGSYVGHLFFNAPDWLIERWMPFKKGIPVSELLATNTGIRQKKTGKGVWVSGASIAEWKLPFLTLDYKPGWSTWSFAGAFHITPDELQNIEEQLQQRSTNIPRIHGDRAKTLAGSMFGGSEFTVEIAFPYQVESTDGQRRGKSIRWVVPLKELKARGGTYPITASGSMSTADRWLFALSMLLPGQEID